MKKGVLNESNLQKYRKKRKLILGIIIAVIILFYAFKNVSTLFRALSAISFLLAFYAVDILFKLDLKNRHYIFITVMAIFGILFSQFYFIYSHYDKIQHLIFPVMLGSIVYHMISKLKLERKWKLTFIFFLIVGVIGLFEIGEYLLDVFFGWNLQGVFITNIQEGLEELNIFMDRIDDTMIDMVLGVVGAAIYIFAIHFWEGKSN